ncbi:hypothetical protein [Pedobacter sp. UYP24]
MPFRNFIYSSNSGFPVKSSNSDFTFKVSFNLSTSVDRIITVSIDSVFGNQATLLEVFGLKKGKVKVAQSMLYPKSGFAVFRSKIDSLKLFGQKDQESLEIPLHQPFTLFVVEVKENEKYNQFRFNTYNPYPKNASEEYERLQKLIFDEFNFHLYTK